jgi:hypothetical protein
MGHRNQYDKDTHESISEIFFRIVDTTLIRNLCPTGSRRNRIYIRGLTAARKRLNTLLRSKKR